MRSRGSYRPTIGANNVKTSPQVVELIDDNYENHNISAKKRKSLEKSLTNVITIESDEEVDEVIHTIDHNYGSMNGLSMIDVKPVLRPAIKRCRKCWTALSTKERDYAYNGLTSADFYLNPRIHPSVISIELKDRTRFDCFNESIAENKHLFKDKTVLIIGSGNGILALFVANALAKTVIVFDRTGISEIIESVIEMNRKKLPKMRTKFYVIRENIDEMVLPNGLSSVDVIVSDWANHSLFYMSMIDCLIKARDKWLKTDGLIFPDSAHMYLVGAHDSIHKHIHKEKRYSESSFVKRIDYWDKNLYGYDMSAFRNSVLSEPFHDSINKSQVITNECFLKRFNFYKMSIEDINFSTDFEMKAFKNNYLQTFVLFFDVIFSKTKTVPLMYSTRTTAPKNLFRPTIFFMDSEKHLTVNKNDKINGRFRYSLTQDLKQMSVNIDFNFKNKFMEKNEKLFYKTNT